MITFENVSKWFGKEILQRMVGKNFLYHHIELDPIVMSIYFMYKITENPFYLQLLSILEDISYYLRYSEESPYIPAQDLMLSYQYIKYELGLLDRHSAVFKEIEKKLSSPEDYYHKRVRLFMQKLI